MCLVWVTSFPGDRRQLVPDAAQSVQHGVQTLPAQLHSRPGTAILVSNILCLSITHTHTHLLSTVCVGGGGGAGGQTNLEVDQTRGDTHPTEGVRAAHQVHPPVHGLQLGQRDYARTQTHTQMQTAQNPERCLTKLASVLKPHPNFRFFFLCVNRYKIASNFLKMSNEKAGSRRIPFLKTFWRQIFFHFVIFPKFCLKKKIK